jgi:D-alanyl-D-alanine dipeptidase
VAEAFNTGESLDTTHLTSGMARALARFQYIVHEVGGSLELKSAYRPPAYQAHLQQVWDKWMQLRNNQSGACQDLRASVQQEFQRHHLLETQRPVNSSDHTRGLAFDATVTLPAHAKIKRRKVTLDSLAHMAGLRRPDILHDPVHFKYVGGRIARG